MGRSFCLDVQQDISTEFYGPCFITQASVVFCGRVGSLRQTVGYFFGAGVFTTIGACTAITSFFSGSVVSKWFCLVLPKVVVKLFVIIMSKVSGLRERDRENERETDRETERERQKRDGERKSINIDGKYV